MRVPNSLVRSAIVAAIALQLWYIFEPRFGPYPYRVHERALAGIERAERPSPESEAAWQREDALLERHRGKRALLGLVMLGLLGALNGSLVYFCWNSGAGNRAG